MIVSENGSFFHGELPKRGTTMAPMKTNVDATDLLPPNLKRARYESRLQEQRVLLPPQDFKAWRSKLDKLKQVVRRPNPSEIQVHQSQFVMSKRVPPGRAASLGQQSAQIQSQCFKLEESLLSKDTVVGADQMQLSPVNHSTEMVSPDSDDLSGSNGDQVTVDKAAAQPGGEIYIEIVPDKASASLKDGLNEVAERTEDADEDTEPSVEPLLQDTATAEHSKTRLVAEESCLGYLYPRKLDESQMSKLAAYGSRLGTQSAIPMPQRSRHDGRVPGASNLEKLMTYPKKIVSKAGATLGFSNVKYPRSFYEEQLERQRQELRSASIRSPQSQTRVGSALSSAGRGNGAQSGVLPDYAGMLNDKDKEEQAALAAASAPVETDFTQPVSEAMSALVGWEAGQPATDAPSRVLSSNVVTSTRVGGATFVKNNVAVNGTERTGEAHLTTSDGPRETKEQSAINAGANKPLSKTHQRMSNSRLNKSQPVMKRQKRRQIAGLSNGKIYGAPLPPENTQPPLQLANLSRLMSDLQRTGDLHQANEEALKLKQSRNKKSGGPHPPLQLYQRKLNGDVLKSGADLSSAHSKNHLNETLQSFYMTDDRGHLMKLSRSTIFEMNYGDRWDSQRMMPTLNQANTDDFEEGTQYQSAIFGSSGALIDKSTGKTGVDGDMQSGFANYGNRYVPLAHWPLMHHAQLRQQQSSQEPQQMIVTGGHATLSTKGMNASFTSSQKQRGVIPDPAVANDQSNRDLHVLDPTLTIKSGGQKVQAIATRPKEQLSAGEPEKLRQEIQIASQSRSRSPRQQDPEVPIQWQVLTTNQQDFDANMARDRQNTLGPAQMRDNNFTYPGQTSSSTGSKPNKTSMNTSSKQESVTANANALPIMLQNMKNQQMHKLNNQYVSSVPQLIQQQQAQYHVIGRSVSPGLIEAPPRRQSQTRDLGFRPQSNFEKQLPNSSQKPSGAQASGPTTAAFAGNPPLTATGIKALPTGGRLTPINVPSSADAAVDVVGSGPHSPMSQELILAQKEVVVKVQEIIASNAKSGKKHKVSGTSTRQYPPGSKSTNPLMRFDDEFSSNHEVATVNGEAGLNKIKDAKSRDSKYAMHGETVRLENTSSKDKIADGSSFQSKNLKRVSANLEASTNVAGAKRSPEKQQKSPRPSTRTEKQEAPRQPIPIKNPHERVESYGDPLHTSHASLNQNLKSIGTDILEQEAQKQGIDAGINTTKIVAGSRVMSPSDVVFLRANSSEELMALQQMKNMHNSMLINLHERATKNNNSNYLQQTNVFAAKKNSKTHYPSGMQSSYNAFGQKTRSTLENNVGISGTKLLQKHKFNSTITSINIGMQQQQRDLSQSPGQTRNQRSFLPTMPFKQSSFAKTQKAIKQLREGPLRRLKGQENGGNQSQFARLDEQSRGAHHAVGDSRMCLQPDDSTGDLNQSKDQNKLFSMTHTSLEETVDHHNQATATSFGPKRPSKTLRNHQEVAVGSSHDYAEIDASATPGQQQASELEKKELQRHLIDAVSTSEEGRSPIQPGSKKRGTVTGGQGMALLSDYITTQRITMGSSSNVGVDGRATLSGQFTTDEPPNLQLMPGDGSVMIKKRNSPKHHHNHHPAATIYSQQQKSQTSNSLMTRPDAIRTQKARQVIVHKLTMGQATTLPLHSNAAEHHEQHPLVAVGQNHRNPSPTTTSKEPSMIQHSKESSIGVPEEKVEPVKGPRFAANRGRSQKVMLPHTQNVINLGSVPIVTFGVEEAGSTGDSFMKHGGTTKSNMMISQDIKILNQQKNSHSSSSNQHPLGPNNLNYTGAAAKLMSNSEIKARQFIDKQRKRTATLGAQRHQRQIYKVTSDNATTNNQQAANAINEPQVSTSPPIIDFNGETLFDSGMTIKQASIVNQNQAKYIAAQSRKVPQPTRALGLTGTKHTNIVPNANNSIVNNYKAAGSGRKTSNPSSIQQLVPVPVAIIPQPMATKQQSIEDQQTQKTTSLNQRSVIALTRINHQVICASQGLSQYSKNRSPDNSKSPKTVTIPHQNNNQGRAGSSKSPDLQTTLNKRTEIQDRELMLTGANLPLSSNRPGATDPEGASGYGEYLRGSNTDLLDSSVVAQGGINGGGGGGIMRAQTPKVENFSQIITLSKKNNTNNVVDVSTHQKQHLNTSNTPNVQNDKKMIATNGSKTSLLMSNQERF